MKLAIQSPLAPASLPDSGQLSPYQLIGLLTDIAINHSETAERSVNQFISELMTSLEAGRARVFFDNQNRPYGFATWVLVSESTHQSFLNQSTELSGANQLLHNDAGQYLWFLSLICPFCAPLLMLKALKHELSLYRCAHLLGHDNRDTTPRIRRLW
ncbi:MAG: toxin-activating lysine-acyltransferase [Saccharospirillum sp.]